MGSAVAVHPGKRIREGKVSVLGGGGGQETRARSDEGTGKKVRSMMEVKNERWGLTWSNNHSKMKLSPFITQAIHVLIRRFS